MAELARGASNWWNPTLGGMQPEVDALLPYWLGAWCIQIAPPWIPGDFAARLPFMMLLVLSMMATWYGIYYLARNPSAQPVAFAFGGEAHPTDYARAIADGGLLALMSCLGLAQLGHETTPALAQLCFCAWLFYAMAALPYRSWTPGLSAGMALMGLSLSGAPSIALALGLGGAAIYLLASPSDEHLAVNKKWRATGLILMTLVTALFSTYLDLWRWRIDPPHTNWSEWQSLGRLFLWFTWPTWPLTFWTLWHWRRQLFSARFTGLHLWLPIWFVAVASVATLTTSAADRSLLLALPALAALAAFALPTLGRNVSALIDWFTLIFFTGCALVIWVVWISLQTGVPSQPAVNVERLAPGFTHSFSFAAFLIAIAASLMWAWLVKWRVGRHQPAIWKSLVLPAAGSALSWLLLMTLWLPLLDFARSYEPLVRQTIHSLPDNPGCVTVWGLTRSQVAAFQFHSSLKLTPWQTNSSCQWLIADLSTMQTHPDFSQLPGWQFRRTLAHPAERKVSLGLYEQTPKRPLTPPVKPEIPD
ncbi:MAG: putative inner membrane transmembrane protein [Comamonadaceae bacterium]|nr:MAG: putative inner membrane transmembrane protein [Comamonadaceae bacterium]